MRNVSPEQVTSNAPGTYQQIQTRRWNSVQLLLLVIVLVLSAAALHHARAFFIPLALGLFLAVLLWPVQSWLSKRMPGWVAIWPVLMLVLAGFAILGAAVWYTADRVVDKFKESESSFTDSYSGVRTGLEERGIYAGWLPEMGGAELRSAEGTQPGGLSGTDAAATGALPPNVTDWLVSFLTAGLNNVLWVLVVVGLAVGLMLLMLLEVPRWQARLDRVAGAGRSSAVREAVGQIGSQVRRFIIAKTVTGALAGAILAAWCWVMGVSFPVTWGVLQFLFNYIPNIGAFISGIPPTALALIELGVWEAVVFVIGIFVIEMVIGNILDPLLVGDALRMPPAVVLASLMFWGWIWGIAGALLAAPITAALVVALLHIPRLRPFGELLSESSERRMFAFSG